MATVRHINLCRAPAGAAPKRLLGMLASTLGPASQDHWHGPCDSLVDTVVARNAPKQMGEFLDSREPLPDGWTMDKNLCLLQHLQLKCIECPGFSSLSQACMATGCHCYQSEIEQHDPVVDGKRKRTSVHHEEAAVVTEGAGRKMLKPKTTTRKINASMARKIMAVQPQFETYQYGIERENVRTYDKGLEMLWDDRRGQPATYFPIKVRPREPGDPPGSVRVEFVAGCMRDVFEADQQPCVSTLRRTRPIGC